MSQYISGSEEEIESDGEEMVLLARKIEEKKKRRLGMNGQSVVIKAKKSETANEQTSQPRQANSGETPTSRSAEGRNAPAKKSETANEQTSQPRQANSGETPTSRSAEGRNAPATKRKSSGDSGYESTASTNQSRQVSSGGKSTNRSAERRNASRGKRKSTEETSEDSTRKRRRRQETGQSSVNRVVEARDALTQRLLRLKKVDLLNVAKQLCLRHGGQLTKDAVIGNIVSTPQPAVEYSYDEVKQMYLARTGRLIGDRIKTKLITAMRNELPDFDVRKRDAMTGLNWLSYVSAVMNFSDSNAIMMENNFKFKWWTIKADIGKFDEFDDQRKAALRQEWQMLKIYPQFDFVISQEDRDAIDRQVAV